MRVMIFKPPTKMSQIEFFSHPGMGAERGRDQGTCTTTDVVTFAFTTSPLIIVSQEG